MSSDTEYDIHGAILPKNGESVFVTIMHGDVLPAIYDGNKNKFILGFRLPHVSDEGHVIQSWQPREEIQINENIDFLNYE